MGYLGQRMGAYAEYVCMAEDGSLALKPANMSYAEAAAVPYGAIMATSLLRHGNVQPGHKVLINGASGGIGSAAVQLAKYYGAEVTGVCGAPRLEYVKALGADQVIDYATEDFTQNGETYDLIFDVLGKSSFARCKRLAEAQWHLSAGQLQDEGAAADAVDEDAAACWSAAGRSDLRHGERKRREPGFRQRTGRGREVQDDHRSVLSDGAGGRGPPLCRIGTQARGSRHHCWLGPVTDLDVIEMAPRRKEM